MYIRKNNLSMSNYLPRTATDIIHTESEFISMLSDSKRITAIVAYWSLTNNSGFANHLIYLSKIEKVEIEIIVDITKPTNLDVLEELSNAGINVQIFLGRKIKGEKKLLHSKIWHIEKLNSSYILLGSHNITKSSLTGLNIESSVIIDCEKSDRDYFNSLYQSILSSSELFEPSKKKFFLALQHDISLVIEETVFDVFTDRVTDVKEGFVLYLFSNEQNIDINNNDYVRVVGQLDRKFKLFKIRTFSKGNVYPSTVESSDISFGVNRNFVWMDNGLFALMMNSQIQNLGEDQLKRSKSYVALEFLEEIDPKKFNVPKLFRPLWNSDNSLHHRLDKAFSGQLDEFETGDEQAFFHSRSFLRNYLDGDNSFTDLNSEFSLEHMDAFNEENFYRLRDLYMSYNEMLNTDNNHIDSYNDFIKSYNHIVNSMLNFKKRRLRKYKSSYKIHRMKDKESLMKLYVEYFKP
jgi:hypothetical protein